MRPRWTARRVPLYGLLTAEAFSLTGTRVSMVALPWFVLTTTGSATQTGLVALAEMLPLVVLKVLSGPVIDRVGARRVSIVCDLGSVVAVGAIPVLYAADRLSLPVFLLMVAVAGGLRGPGDAAKSALIPRLVERAEVPMERATGLYPAVERSACSAGVRPSPAASSRWSVPRRRSSSTPLSFLVSAVVLGLTTRSLAGPATPVRGTGAVVGRRRARLPHPAARGLGLPAPRPGARRPDR